MSHPQPCHRQFHVVKPFGDVVAKSYNHHVLLPHLEEPGNCERRIMLLLILEEIFQCHTNNFRFTDYCILQSNLLTEI